MNSDEQAVEWRVFGTLKVGNRLVQFYKAGDVFAWVVDGGLGTGYVDMKNAIGGALSWLRRERTTKLTS